MKKMKSVVIFEKKLNNSYSSESFTIRLVRQETPENVRFILEKIEKIDAMGNPVWLELSTEEIGLAIGTFGEFFHDLKQTDFKSLQATVKENKSLKDLLEIVLATHYKKGSHIDFDVTGQGERLIKKISKELFNDLYPDEDLVAELIKKHSKSI